MSLIQIIEQFMASLGMYLGWDTTLEAPTSPSQPSNPPTSTMSTPTENTPAESPTMAQKIYDIAKANLGKHIFAEANIPQEVGCVTAVAYILEQAGIDIPKSIVGVNALIDWLLANGFKETTAGSIGSIVTAHRQDKNDPSYAHTGIVLAFGIASNDSSTGKFNENYTMSSWHQAFDVMHSSHTRYFTIS
jgi:hypothetical protein